VPRNDAVTETINGERHYFCSEECRVQFQKEQSSDQGV
jgi:YHS domain-containing protein